MNKGLLGFPKGCGVDDPDVFPSLLDEDVDSKIERLPPVSTQDYSAWYDASDFATLTISGGEITTWADKSGFARDMTGAGGTTPSYGSRMIGGYLVADFDGSNDRMAATYNYASRPFSFAAVVEIDNIGLKDLWGSTNGAASRGYIRMNTTGLDYVRATVQDNIGPTGFQGGIPCFVAMSADIPIITFRVQQMEAIAQDNGSFVANVGLQLGRYATAAEFYDGAIGEIIFWERAMTGDELDGLFEYMQEKWSLPGHI